MKKAFMLYAGIALLGLSLCSCKGKANNTTTTTMNSDVITTTITETTPKETETAKDPEESKTEITESFAITTTDGAFSKDGDNYTITKGGTYTLSGLLSDGQIIIDAGEDSVELELNEVEMCSTSNSVIYCINADELKIKAMENTYNSISDKRANKTEDVENQGEGAIYAKCDLKLVGKGSLVVSGTYNNGIHTTKDLSIKNVTLKSTAYNNSLKGNDSISIESGNITAISTGGDGLKTEDSDVSSKGNQRGTVTISGGIVDIYSCCDGIDASYNAEIKDSAVVHIYTDKYSSYSGSVASSTSSDLYISSTYSSSTYRFAAYFYNDSTDGVWVDASYATSGSSSSGRPGQNRTYYYYKLSKPSGYSNVAFYMFKATEKTNSVDTCVAKTSGGTINQEKDMFSISSVSSSTITGSWSTYTTQSQSQGGFGGFGGMQEGNKDKSSYSAKGIKAHNEVLISGGTISIEAYDDTIHASGGDTLENGESGLGNVTITGGYLDLSSADDGIHADNIVSISGGEINITKSYEGVEGNLIYFKGGSTIVAASDDGVNASSGSTTPCIYVSGGYLDVTVGTGDVDGIDSNGNYVQTGGFVISRNGTQATGGMASGLDTDGSVTITGGTFICAGAIGETPTNSSNLVVFGSVSSSPFGRPGGYSSSTVSFEAGTYTISNTSIEFTLSTSYNGLWICSDELITGTSYTIKGGTEKTWTQSSGKTQVS